MLLCAIRFKSDGKLRPIYRYPGACLVIVKKEKCEQGLITVSGSMLIQRPVNVAKTCFGRVLLKEFTDCSSTATKGDDKERMSVAAFEV